jgi:hypothetical protein
MKIQQWLGFNEDTSQYLLRTGELRALVNLQPRRSGMLTSRPGLAKLYGKYDDESVVGLYRRDTVFGNPNDFLLFQKTIADRVLTAAQIAAKEFPQEDVWIVRRIQGFQERVIAQLASSPNGISKIANFCVCEDRHGRAFLFFGHGAEPMMYRPASLATVAMPLGMDTPLVAPVVVPGGSGYFIETIDVTGSGGGFYAPPTITVDGGDPDRPPKVKGLVQGGSLVGIDVEDGGANFKSFPKITVSSDSVGGGFRAVGNLETDPGVQGFVSTTAGVVSGTPPAANETVGATNGVLGNSIMYRSSDVVATTKTVALASPQAVPPNFVADVYELPPLTPVAAADDTLYMLVESLSGVRPGDLVTIQGASQPYPFGPTAVVRVDAIDSRAKTMENKSVRAIRLSKQWQPVANASYTVQFRRESDVAYAKASWDSTRKRFRASVPLRTLRGTGRGAEATLEFSPAAYGYGLGTFTTSGWTTPTGGVESARFAFQQIGWNSYINGEYWEGSAQDKKDSKENKTYAGLQASGGSYVFGYSGSVSAETKGKSSNRRADVYWPDYSKISVWVCTGTLQSNASRWTRLDATVYDGNTENPYAIVDLKPTANSQISTQTGKLSYSSVATNYGAADDFRYPKVKIKLKRCPDSWVISTQTNGSFNYNLPSSEKEKQDARIGWWHSASTTPRPIVDVVRNTSNTISWDTVEVLDPGAGWEMGTQFAIRLHQANPYDQRTDYNTAVREQKIKAGHQPFSTSDRYVQFLFKATEPDDLTPAGPPGPLAGSQYVDVAGSGYRAGDTASVTILKRPLSSGVASDLTEFDGVFAQAGQRQEATSIITGTRSNTNATVTVSIDGEEVGTIASGGSGDWTFTVRRVISSLAGLTAAASSGTAAITAISVPLQAGAIIRAGISPKTARVKVGDVLECSDAGVLLPGSTVIAKRELGTSYFFDLDKCRGVNPSSWSWIYAIQYDTPGGKLLKLTDMAGETLTSPTEYWRVNQVLRANTAVNNATVLLRLTELITSSDGLFARVQIISGEAGWVQGPQTFLPSFTIRAVGGISPAQTVQFKAEQILAGTGEQKVTSVRIVSGGRDYYAPPEVLVRGGGGGYGLAVTPIVDGGKVTACEITDPGRAYTQSPELYTDSSPATAVPVMRPTMRGKYRCAYRFVDRSETEILSTEIFRCRGDSPTRLQLQSTAGIKPGMFLESERLPQGTKVLSVHGNEVEVNQEATGDGYIGAVVVENPGSGYTQTEVITVSVPGSVSASFPVVRRLNDQGSYSVDSVTVSSAGTTKFPVGKIPLTFSSPEGGGSVATGYAVIARFDTASTYDKSVLVRDYSKPTAYSSFSPIIDVDAGPNELRTHSSEMKWTIPGVTPPTRADMVELWRTSADQSLVFYRLEAYGKPTDSGVEIVGADTLNDEELFDPERPNYAAMPVVLPNGNLNAYRFGKPRTDMSVCVAFQDRLWYGVSTSGDDANTLFYSEFDEFESCPDAYDLPIQNNQRATDSLTALVPYGSMLLAMQNAHTYSVTYNTDPSIDGAIQMLTHRGCLHQRCWDMDNGVFYSVDESGIYSMDRSGNIQDLSQPFRDWFTSELLDFAKRDRFFLTICPKTRILRFFCCLTTQNEDSPTFALCLDLDRKTWWSENYPNSVCSAVTGRPGKSRINSSILGAVDGNMYELTGDRDHANQTLVKCTVTNGGKGYKRSPKVTCPSSKGVQLKGVISEGRLVDVLVLSSGWDLKWGTQLLTEDGTKLDSVYPFSLNATPLGSVQLATHDGRLLQGAEYAPVVLDIEPPPEGGTQATAVADYAVTERLIRDCTVSQGEDFVRLRTFVTDPVDSYIPPFITTHNGLKLLAVGGVIDGLPFRAQPQAVEVGMEAIGDFIPLNAFVSRIDGADIYLEHPDGTPVSVLGGNARTDTYPIDGYKESGGSQAIVYFRKAYHTHIPFRLATGAMQLLNEENITRNGDGLIDRSVSLVFAPTDTKKEVEIIQYYNDNSTPRANVMRRSRGGPGGFEHRQDSASTVLNLERSASLRADATGVAKAMFAGRVYTDATGEDQHIQVELYGRPASANGGGDLVAQKFVMHSMTVNGVIDNGE